MTQCIGFMAQQASEFSSVYDPESNKTVYTLKESKVAPGLCHLFTPTGFTEDLLILTTLEHAAFPPKTPLNEKFTLTPFQLGAVSLVWASFPKEYEATCAKIAQIYKMTLVNGPVNVHGSKDRVEIPCLAGRTFCFQGKRCGNEAALKSRQEEARQLGGKLYAEACSSKESLGRRDSMD